MTLSPFKRLQQQVIEPGICTHCGTCAGLSGGTVEMVRGKKGPLPHAVPGCRPDVSELAYAACPGKGVDYPAAYERLSGQLPDNWLLGPYHRVTVGYSAREEIRRRGASGGVITQTLLYLLEQGEIDGAVVVVQGRPEPWLASAVIACTAEEILAASQSVYIPTPVNSLLPEMAAFEGRLAYVGLPDQVAALRCLQAASHPGALKVDYVLGPYVGTAIYLEAIKSYLRSNGVNDLQEVAELSYREGEWPGYLQIRLQDGRVLRAEKFYYNYLIPFYVTQASLQAVDFTNELTDISVGDAWHPQYEAQGAGFSVVVARTAKAEALLARMQGDGQVVLEDVPAAEALAMHGHMLDFKKRGSFIRNDWRRAVGLPAPSYGYRPRHIPLSRQLVEVVISGLFTVGRTRPARWLVEQIPLPLLGPAFNRLRQSWKEMSKPVKRQGLGEVEFVLTAEGPDLIKQTKSPATEELMPNFLERVKQEIEHWRRRSWSFAQLEEHFDHLAADYDEINEGAHSYFRRFTDTLRIADLPDEAYVLDICARTGNGTAFFYEQGKVGQAVCADVSREMGQRCEERLQEVGFDNYRWVQLHSYDLPFEDDEFDVVLSLESVEHFDLPELFVQELGRVTRPNGTLILTTPNVLWEPVHALAYITTLHHSEGPHRFVPSHRLRHAVSRAGFQIEHAETTVLIPAGPPWLLRLGERLESRTKDSLMPLLGLRQVLICRKLL